MKRLAKRVLGPAYSILVKARSSELARTCRAAVGFLPYEYRRFFHKDIFAIDIHRPMGAGAVISQALMFHRHAEQFGMYPAIISTNCLYAPKRNVDFLSLYFIRHPVPSSVIPIQGMGYDFAFRYGVGHHMSLAEAARLFALHFQPREEIVVRIDQVLAGRRSFDLSVHFRGTDKILESGSVNYKKILDQLDLMLEEKSESDIFLATDDKKFEIIARERYHKCSFTTFNIGDIPDGTARHFSEMNPRDKAVEALVNIFLLSYAPVCVRTSSFLSAISRIANPNMQTITVNRTLKGSNLFPEREIIESEVSGGTLSINVGRTALSSDASLGGTA